MKLSIEIAVLFSLFCIITACGEGGDGEGNNSPPEPVCETIPQPSEMNDCVAEDIGPTLFTRSDVEKLCENRCSTLPIFRTSVNTPLSSLEVLNGIQRISGQMSVIKAKHLTSLHGAGNIEVVGPSEPWSPRQVFSIEETLALETTDGFSALRKVQGGNLHVVLNSELTDLSGFPELEEIQGALIIELNGELTDISGFPRLNTVTEGIRIDGNGKLSRCKAQEFVDGIENVGGEVVIRANGPCE